MKKYLVPMLFLAVAAFCFSTVHANEFSEGPEIELTIMNTSESELRVRVEEEVKLGPYNYSINTILYVKLAPGEVVAMPVNLATVDDTNRTLILTAKGDKKHEKGGSKNFFQVDISKSNHFGFRLWEGVMPKLSNWHYIRVVADLVKE